MTKRVSYMQMLEDGLVDAQDESERLETLFLTALRHIVNLEAGFTGPMPEREARGAVGARPRNRQRAVLVLARISPEPANECARDCLSSTYN